MNLAYIILAHKSPKQVKRLISRLNCQPCTIYIHLDAGMHSVLYQEFVADLKDFLNVKFVKRYYTNWGSVRLVKATLTAMQAILLDIPDIDYVCLLSGQDYPIRPIQNLYSYLQHNYGKSYIKYWPLPYSDWADDGGLSRINSWHFDFEIRNHRIRIWAKNKINHILNLLFPNRKFLQGYQPIGGSQWWCLHRDSIFKVFTSLSNRGNILSYFSTVRIPDEMFFQTILLNQIPRVTVENRSLTYVDWKGPPYPRILRENDFDILASLQGTYFARKFDEKCSQSLLDRIDKEIIGVMDEKTL